MNQQQHKTPVRNIKIKWLKRSDKYKTVGRKDIHIQGGTIRMIIKIFLQISCESGDSGVMSLKFWRKS